MHQIVVQIVCKVHAHRWLEVLDRRLDPSRRLTLTTAIEPTQQVIQHIARQIPNAGVSFSDDFIYIGPEESARSLRTLLEVQKRKLSRLRGKVSAEATRHLRRKTEVAWDELSVSSDVIQKLADSANWELVGLDQVPHDVWHAGQLCRLSTLRALMVLLIQFDLTIEIQPEGQRLVVVRAPKNLTVERRHSFETSRQDTFRQLITSQYPGLSLKWSRRAVTFNGTVEQHEAIDDFLSNPDGIPPPSLESLKTRRLTLSLNNDVTYRQLIAHFEESGIPIRVADSLDVELDTVCEVSLRDLPGSEFFPRLFEQLPVRVVVEDTGVILRQVD